MRPFRLAHFPGVGIRPSPGRRGGDRLTPGGRPMTPLRNGSSRTSSSATTRPRPSASTSPPSSASPATSTAPPSSSAPTTSAPTNSTCSTSAASPGAASTRSSAPCGSSTAPRSAGPTSSRMIPYGKKPKTLPVVLSPDEVARLLDAVADPAAPALCCRPPTAAACASARWSACGSRDIDGARDGAPRPPGQGPQGPRACRCRRGCSRSCGPTGASTGRRPGCSPAPGRAATSHPATLQRACPAGGAGRRA